MTTTAPEGYERHSGRTPERPTDEEFSQLPWFDDFPEEFVASGRAHVVHFAVRAQQTPPRQAGIGTPLRFDIDESGEIMAWDVLGAALGLGPSPYAAAAAWEVEAREVYDDLAAHEAQLHPRLLRQLRFLRFYFG